MLKLTSKLE